MADNVELNLMSGGKIVAADEISGAVFQRIKITLGADGVNDGDIASGNPMPVTDSALATILTLPSAIANGVTTVTTAGTDVALAASTACKRVVIQAQTDNTGVIAVGGAGVDATIATGTGIILHAGDSVELKIDNLADVFIDSTVNGEGVRYTYLT